MASLAFQAADVIVPTQGRIDAHYAQANALVFLPTSNTGGYNIKLMDMWCMIPLMWAPSFIGGGTPKETLKKIELMAASVSPDGRGLYEFILQCGAGSMHHVASGPFRA